MAEALTARLTSAVQHARASAPGRNGAGSGPAHRAAARADLYTNQRTPDEVPQGE